jgi:transposase-like protein
MEALDWGPGDDDDFYLVALVHSEPLLEVKFDFVRYGRTLAMSGVEVLVAGVIPRQGITAELYRAVPIGRAYALASTVIRDGKPSRRRTMPDLPAVMPVRGWIDTEETERRQGRRSLTDAFLAEVADAYVRNIRELHPKPVQAVADEYGVSSSTVSTSWLPKASGRKLLLDRQRGKAGGALSPRAQQLIGRRATDRMDDRSVDD